MPEIKMPKLVRDGQDIWIPPLPMQWEDWIGPYDSLEEARQVRDGLERTISSLDWQFVGEEMVDEFERQWVERVRNQ